MNATNSGSELYKVSVLDFATCRYYVKHCSLSWSKAMKLAGVYMSRNEIVRVTKNISKRR